jgi:hypothetical protein
MPCLLYALSFHFRSSRVTNKGYKLIDGEYVLESEGQQPYWMPEIGLAIGAERRLYHRSRREWLYWYDQNSFRYPTPTERANAESQLSQAASEQAQAESQRADLAIAAQMAAEQENMVLRQRLRDLGIDPDA